MQFSFTPKLSYFISDAAQAATALLFLTHMISCLALANIETRICFNRRQTCVQSAAHRQMHCLHAGILIDEFYLNPVLLNTAMKRSLITYQFSTCIGPRILNHCDLEALSIRTTCYNRPDLLHDLQCPLYTDLIVRLDEPSYPAKIK